MLMLTIVPVAPTGAAVVGATGIFIDFETGTVNGFEPRGEVTIALSDEQSKSGNNSLLMSRIDGGSGFGGVGLPVTQHIIPDEWNNISFWVMMKTAEPTYLLLNTQLRVIDSTSEWAEVLPIDAIPVSQSSDWAQINARFYYDSSKYYLDDVMFVLDATGMTDEFYIDDFSFNFTHPDSLPATEGGPTEVFIDFEDGTLGGFASDGIGDNFVRLTITDEESHTGNYSLLVSEMQEPLFTPKLQVAQYIIPDTWYEATFWVKIKTPEPTALNLWTQMMPLNSTQDWGVYNYDPLGHALRSSSEGWIEIRYVFYYDSSLYDLSSVKIFIHTSNATDEFYIDSVSFRIADFDRNIRDAARLPSLRETYQDYFMIGNITDTFPFHPHKGTIDFYRRHFNIIKVLGNLGWTRNFMPEKWVVDFTTADKELEILHPDDFTLVFPSIIYRMSNAEWLARNPDGTLLTRAEAIANMERYINTVSAHYEGRFDIWVVVNEPRSNLWNESGFWIEGDGHLASWYLAFDNGADRNRGESGADYVEYAFRFARAADPNRKLYLGEQGEQHAIVADNIADLVGGINSRWLAEGNERLLIEGIIMQGHYFLDTPLEDIERTLSLFASLGVSISIGELDIPLFRTADSHDVTGVLTQELLEQQAEMYARLFLLFKEYADVIDYVTIWGVIDHTSWYNVLGPDGNVGRRAYPQYPVLFDDNFVPKLAYFAVIDPEGYLAGDFDTPEKIAAWLEANMLPEVVLEDDTVTDNEPDAPAPPPATTLPSDSPLQEENNAVTQDAGTEDGVNTVLWVVLGVVGVVGVVVVVVLVVKKK